MRACLLVFLTQRPSSLLLILRLFFSKNLSSYCNLFLKSSFFHDLCLFNSQAIYLFWDETYSWLITEPDIAQRNVIHFLMPFTLISSQTLTVYCAPKYQFSSSPAFPTCFIIFLTFYFELCIHRKLQK